MTRCGRISLVVLGVLVCLTNSPSIVVAQSPTGSVGKDRVWFAVAAGWGRTRNDGPLPASSGLSGGLWLTYQGGPVLFTGRVTSVWDPFEADLVGDAALLVGIGTRSHGGHVSISAGPAMTGGNLNAFDDTPTEFTSRLGAAVQVQALALPIAGLGLGITGFANFNARQSFGGVMLTLAFGQLR